MQIQYNSLPMYFQYIDGFNIFNMRTYADIYNWTSTHTYTHRYVYIYIYTCIYVYIYIYTYVYPINPNNAHIEKCKRVCLRSPSFIVSCPRHQLPAALILEDDFDLQPDFASGSWGWSCAVLIWYDILYIIYIILYYIIYILYIIYYIIYYILYYIILYYIILYIFIIYHIIYIYYIYYIYDLSRDLEISWTIQRIGQWSLGILGNIRRITWTSPENYCWKMNENDGGGRHEETSWDWNNDQRRFNIEKLR